MKCLRDIYQGHFMLIREKKKNTVVSVKDTLSDIAFLDVGHPLKNKGENEKIKVTLKKVLMACVLVTQKELLLKDTMSERALEKFFGMMSEMDLTDLDIYADLSRLSVIGNIWDTMYNMGYIPRDYFYLIADQIIILADKIHSAMSRETKKTDYIHRVFQGTHEGKNKFISPAASPQVNVIMPNKDPAFVPTKKQETLKTLEKSTPEEKIAPKIPKTESENVPEDQASVSSTRKKRIWEVLKNYGPQSVRGIADRLGYKCSLKTIGRDLIALQKSKMIEQIGENRWVRYRLRDR